MIYVLKNGKRASYGSGVLIDYDEILTASHVTSAGDSYEIIYNDRRTTTATLKDDAPEIDIAILEPAEKETKPVKIGDNGELESSDKIFVISSPKSNRNTIIDGTVFGLSITNNIVGFRTSALTNSGSSGGGVFNSMGKLIGIIASGDNKTHSFAVPMNDIRKKL